MNRWYGNDSMKIVLTDDISVTTDQHREAVVLTAFLLNNSVELAGLYVKYSVFLCFCRHQYFFLKMKVKVY